MATTLCDFVQYTDSKGHAKAALVTGTPETIGASDVIPALEPGELHLMVFSPTGNHYARHNVLHADEPLAGSGSWHER